MGLDIRLPIGLMFLIIGAMQAAYGLFTAGDEMYMRHSEGQNINLYWGLVQVVFGALMFYFGRKGTKATMTPAENNPEGRAIEAREKREGLEH